MAIPASEAGHLGPLTSLGGLVDESGAGRITSYVSKSIPAGSVTLSELLAPSNGKRIAAVIFRNNTEPDEPVTVIFGPTAVVAAGEPLGAAFTLWPKGVLQIDERLPWTGPISFAGGAITTGSAIAVTFSEISLR